MPAAYFADAAGFRRWLERNHNRASELIVGMYTKTSGRSGLTYPQALDEALCFGWIDGVRRKDGPDGYTTRFTPRRSRSIWSLVNTRHAERLIAAGRMHAAGLAAFAKRIPEKQRAYSFENRPQTFPAPLAKMFRANAPALRFWNDQPPGYRRVATWFVVSAKQQETRERRLARLIADSAAGRRLAAIAGKQKAK